MQENGFTLKKAWLYPAETNMKANIDDTVFLTNRPVQVKSLLHRLKQTGRSIGCYVNANRTELMCFKQGAINKLNDKPL